MSMAWSCYPPAGSQEPTPEATPAILHFLVPQGECDWLQNGLLDPHQLPQAHEPTTAERAKGQAAPASMPFILVHA